MNKIFKIVILLFLISCKTNEGKYTGSSQIPGTYNITIDEISYKLEKQLDISLDYIPDKLTMQIELDDENTYIEFNRQPVENFNQINIKHLKPGPDNLQLLRVYSENRKNSKLFKINFSLPFDKKIAIVGDSISQGVNPETRRRYGWVEMITQTPDEDGNIIEVSSIYDIFHRAYIRNFSRGGSKAVDWAHNPKYLEQVLEFNPDIVVIYLGGNDFLEMLRKDMDYQSSLEQIVTNINKIANLMKEKSPDVTIINAGYYDLFDGKSENLIGPFKDYKQMSQLFITINSLLSENADKNGYFYVDISDIFSGHAYGSEVSLIKNNLPYVRLPLSKFDIHPNTLGHKKLAEAFYKVFIEVSKDMTN